MAKNRFSISTDEGTGRLFNHERKTDSTDEFVSKLLKEHRELPMLKQKLRVLEQQPQPQANSQEASGAVENPQQAQTQGLALTPTEIISPNVQIVTVGGREIIVSNTQREKKVWKDGQWTYSMRAAGDLSFLDSIAKLGEDHTRKIINIKIDGYREIEKIKIDGLRERAQIRSGNYQDVDAQETPYKKYDPTAGVKWCPHGKGRVYPSQCEICQIDCEYSQPQTQRSSEFKCPAGDDVHQETCLMCQQRQLEPRCPKIRARA